MPLLSDAWGRVVNWRIDVGHSPEFLRRRLFNWLPLGLTYAFLYMGRYNLTVSKNALGDLMSKADFGTIFFWGTLTYGCAFVINGPLTDRWGGRVAILLATAGSSVMNALMGLVTWAFLSGNLAAEGQLVPVYSALYAANMYFQSFGAVSIVKVNATWFHVRERGVFGGIFGVLISLGIYFAFDWGRFIVTHAPVWWVFALPAVLLALFLVVDAMVVRDSPSAAGFQDFDTGDASSGDDGERLPVWEVASRMFRHPVIVVIAAVEFCSGFLRNAVMHWYVIFAKQTGAVEGFVYQNWGLLLCLAGIFGGIFAGNVSDRLFQSRRGPVAGLLYGGLVVGSLLSIVLLTTPLLGALVVAMSLCVIGVHGMLSGTASMDFGGRKNVGVAVGLIDGFVYLGTAAQAIILGQLLPKGEAAQDVAAWSVWPWAMLVVAAVGFVLATRIWHAKPQPRAWSRKRDGDVVPQPAPVAAALAPNAVRPIIVPSHAQASPSATEPDTLANAESGPRRSSNVRVS